MAELPLDYVAGLFDGEGWFSVTRTKLGRHKREFQYQAHAGLVMREKPIVEALQNQFGGTIRSQKQYNPNHSLTYRWRITGHNVLKFSVLMQERLIAKRDQCFIINRFQTLKESSGNKPTTDLAYDLYGAIYQRMKELNQKGVGK